VEFEKSVAGRSQLDWFTGPAITHAKFVQDLTDFYIKAAREALKRSPETTQRLVELIRPTKWWYQPANQSWLCNHSQRPPFISDSGIEKLLHPSSHNGCRARLL
jgi:hypothetical protein